MFTVHNTQNPEGLSLEYTHRSIHGLIDRLIRVQSFHNTVRMYPSGQEQHDKIEKHRWRGKCVLGVRERGGFGREDNSPSWEFDFFFFGSGG